MFYSKAVLRFLATFEVATGSFYYELPKDHPFWPIRGYVARLQSIDMSGTPEVYMANLEAEFATFGDGAGSYALCDHCDKAMWRSYGWWDRHEVDTMTDCFYCRECNDKLYEEEFGGFAHDSYYDTWFDCQHCGVDFVYASDRDAHENTCPDKPVYIEF